MGGPPWQRSADGPHRGAPGSAVRRLTDRMLAPPQTRHATSCDGLVMVANIASGNPVVSILTPAYNSAAFIAETIESVLQQTWSDFELLIIDDGSTDGTMDVVQSAARGDSRVKTFGSAHGGPAVARDEGLKHARGQFFALLDSDDVWDPRYLSEQLSLLRWYP